MTPDHFTAPHSAEAEQAVIGGLMLDNDAIDRMGPLRAGDFYRHDHRLVFEAVTGLLALQQPADITTVFDRLAAAGHLDTVGGLPRLHEISTNTPSASNIAHYAKIVRDKALQRGLLAAAGRVQEIVTERSGKSAHEMLDAAQAEFGRLADGTIQREPASIQDAMSRYIDDLDRRFHGEADHPGIPTGLADLDAMLNGGLRRGALVTLGARPGMGKSALGETIACNAGQAGHSVLFLSMEMPEAEVTERAIANIGRGSVVALAAADKRMDEGQWARITHAAQAAAKMRMFIDDQPGLALLDVVTKARAIKRKHGLDLLIVDYLQLMVGSEEKRYQQIEAITKGLKILAKTLGIAILALSQFSRDIEKRPNPRPKPSDFRDGGSIEQDSDILMGLYREEQDNPDTQWAGVAELFVMKNRQGKIGKVALTYVGDSMRFEGYAGAVPQTDRQPRRASRGFDA